MKWNGSGLRLATAVCTAASLAACSFSTPSVALTVDGQDVPAGVYLSYQLMNYQQAAGELSSAGEKVKMNAPYQETTFENFVQTETAQAAGRYVWIQKEFEKQGLSFTEAEAKDMKKTVSDVYAQLSSWLGENGIGEGSYYKYYETEVKYSKLSEKYNKEKADSVTDEQIKQYLDDTYLRVKQLTLPTALQDGTPLEEDVRKELDKLLESAQKDIEGGADFDQIAEKYLKQACEKTEREYDEAIRDTYLTAQFYPQEESSTDSAFMKEVRGAKQGVCAITDRAGTKVLYQRVPNYESEEDLENVRAQTVTEMINKEYEKKIDDAVASMKIDAEQAKKNFPVSRVRV